MIIIYHGSHLFLPRLACCLHLVQQDMSQKIHLPFTLMGRDKLGNVVCCLVYGRYHMVYERAITGISHIFNLDVRLVDVDKLLFTENRVNLSFRAKLLLVRFFPGLFPDYLTQVKQKLFPALKFIREAEL